MRNKFTTRYFVPLFIVFEHSFYSIESSMIEGRAVRVSKMSTDVPSERFKGLHAIDFCLQNLLAQNADLKSMSLSDDLFVGHDKCVEFCSSLNLTENEK